MAFFNSKFNGKKAAKLALMSTGAVLFLNTSGNATVLPQSDYSISNQVVSTSEIDGFLQPETRNPLIDQPIQITLNPCPTEEAYPVENEYGYILFQCEDGEFVVVLPDGTDLIPLYWNPTYQYYTGSDRERTYVYQGGELIIR